MNHQPKSQKNIHDRKRKDHIKTKYIIPHKALTTFQQQVKTKYYTRKQTKPSPRIATQKNLCSKRTSPHKKPPYNLLLLQNQNLPAH